MLLSIPNTTLCFPLSPEGLSHSQAVFPRVRYTACCGMQLRNPQKLLAVCFAIRHHPCYTPCSSSPHHDPQASQIGKHFTIPTTSSTEGRKEGCRSVPHRDPRRSSNQSSRLLRTLPLPTIAATMGVVGLVRRCFSGMPGM